MLHLPPKGRWEFLQIFRTATDMMSTNQSYSLSRILLFQRRWPCHLTSRISCSSAVDEVRCFPSQLQERSRTFCDIRVQVSGSKKVPLRNPLHPGNEAGKRGIQPCFETNGRHRQKFKTKVPLAPYQGLMSSKYQGLMSSK